ncbi:oligosaccharide flippase family protein [Candidatus Dojkabacteria bacterium]|nr:oligosaccharide flippase family protein [Candidatus Dojkabacteria bacterium]
MLRIFSNTFVMYLNRTLAVGSNTIKRTKNLLTMQQNSILNAAFLLILIVLVTKFTGLIFNSLSIGFVGADAYNEFVFAANIPEIISASILLGAISASVIPTLVQAREEEGHNRFLSVLNTLINGSLVLFAVIAVFIAIFAGELMPWLIDHVLKPVEPPTEEQLDRIVLMLRVLLIPQVILGVSTYISSSLNVMQRFVVPQLAPLFYNFGRILAVVLLVPVFGQNPWVLVYGTLIGAIFHLLIQIPLMRHLNIKYIPTFKPKDKYFKNILVIALPRVFGLSAEQVAIGVDRLIAFGLIGNSLAAYELAIRLVAIPMSLFGLTFSTASFPIISKAYIQKDYELFRNTFTRVLNQILFLSFPITIVLIVLRLPITRLFYGIFGNSFTWDETRMVAWVVMFFAFGLTFEALRSLVFKTYYAVNNSIVPLISAVFVVVVGITTGILFTNYFSHFETFSFFSLSFEPDYFFSRGTGKAGVGGLALSASLVYTLEFFGLLIYLNYKYLRIRLTELTFPIAKKIIISVVTAFLTYMLYTLYNDVLDTSKTGQIFILTSTTVMASFLFYFWLSFFTGVQEIDMIIRIFKRLKYRNGKFGKNSTSS